MKTFLMTLALIAGLATPLAAQTPAPPSPAPARVSAAPRVPVVQAPRNGHAQKSIEKKPATKPKPEAKPAAPPPAPVVPPVVEPTPPPAIDPAKGGVTGLPVPRYMSLRFDDVNLRVGPGTRYPIDWVYHRRDLPVEILRELEEWRLVQDQDNIRGWVRAPTLSPRRGIVVRGGDRTLRAKPADDAAAVALLKPGVIGRLRACPADGKWCEVEVSAFRGWLKRDDIFGVYPNEAVGG